MPAILPRTILWVRLSSPHGGYKERPAVALTAPDGDGKLKIVVASTQIGRDPDNEVELPSHPSRHPLTKLKCKTVAVANWVEDISLADVCEVKGEVPRIVFEKILDKLAQNVLRLSEPT